MKTDPSCPGADAYKKLNDRDGFDGMNHKDKFFSGYAHISKERWTAIFGPKHTSNYKLGIKRD